jgi:hypothetical protein
VNSGFQQGQVAPGDGATGSADSAVQRIECPFVPSSIAGRPLRIPAPAGPDVNSRGRQPTVDRAQTQSALKGLNPPAILVSQPGRATDNSPPIHRWGCPETGASPVRDERTSDLQAQPRASAVPDGTRCRAPADPSVETLGYDLPPSRAGGASTNFKTLPLPLRRDAENAEETQREEAPSPSATLCVLRVSALNAPAPPHPSPLPPGEGESGSASDQTGHPGFQSARQMVLPPPAAEGRGGGQHTEYSLASLHDAAAPFYLPAQASARLQRRDAKNAEETQREEAPSPSASLCVLRVPALNAPVPPAGEGRGRGERVECRLASFQDASAPFAPLAVSPIAKSLGRWPALSDRPLPRMRQPARRTLNTVSP